MQRNIFHYYLSLISALVLTGIIVGLSHETAKDRTHYIQYLSNAVTETRLEPLADYFFFVLASFNAPYLFLTLICCFNTYLFFSLTRGVSVYVGKKNILWGAVFLGYFIVLAGNGLIQIRYFMASLIVGHIYLLLLSRRSKRATGLALLLPFFHLATTPSVLLAIFSKSAEKVVELLGPFGRSDLILLILMSMILFSGLSLIELTVSLFFDAYYIHFFEPAGFTPTLSLVFYAALFILSPYWSVEKAVRLLFLVGMAFNIVGSLSGYLYLLKLGLPLLIISLAFFLVTVKIRPNLGGLIQLVICCSFIPIIVWILRLKLQF